MVPRERIAAVSFLAHDPGVSAHADRASGLRSVRGHAEEVLPLDPDLVLAGRFTTPFTVGLLRRLGRNVVVMPIATGIEGIRDNLIEAGRVLGREGRAREIVGDFDRRLAELAPPIAGPRPAAIVYYTSGLAAGSGTLADEALRAAGFRNLGAELRRGRAGRLPLEVLVTHPPDLLVLNEGSEASRTIAADNLRHPAFRRLVARTRTVRVPQALWICGTSRFVEVVERLAAARRRLR